MISDLYLGCFKNKKLSLDKDSKLTYATLTPDQCIERCHSEVRIQFTGILYIIWDNCSAL